MATETVATKASSTEQSETPWGSSLDKFNEWDPKGAELLLRVGKNPWTSGVLPRKEVELIYLALNCACTNLDEEGTRRRFAPLSKRERRETRSSWFSSVVSGWPFTHAAWAPLSCLRK